MKRLFRWLFRLLVLSIVLLVAAALLKDALLKGWIERQVHARTGLRVSIQTLEAGLFTPTVRIERARLFNPAEFGGSVLLDISEASFEYDLAKALAGSARLRWLRLQVGEIHLVRNAAGQTNVAAILPALTGASSRPQEIDRRRWRFGGIDQVYLTLEKARHTDLAQPARNWTRAVGWKDYEIKNIRTAAEAGEWVQRVLNRVTPASANAGPGS